MSDASSKKFELTTPMAVLCSGLLIAGAIVVSSYTAPVDGQVEGASYADVPAPTQEDHWRGSKDAPVVLVEYSDFQCPYCQMINPSIEKIVAESNGGVAWVYRHLPLESIHPEARPSAVAAECVAEQLGEDAFWTFADTMFNNQSLLSDGFYAQTAATLGADEAMFASCIASGTYDALVDRYIMEAQTAGAGGTPFTVITTNGKQYPFSGALPYNQIKAIIAAAAGEGQ